MTMTYASPLPQRIGAFGQSFMHPSTAPAQGGEGIKLRRVFARLLTLSTPVRHSAEAEQLDLALEHMRLALSQQLSQSNGDMPYEYIPVKPAFTLNVTYRFVGRLKPRQFELDE